MFRPTCFNLPFIETSSIVSTFLDLQKKYTKVVGIALAILSAAALLFVAYRSFKAKKSSAEESDIPPHVSPSSVNKQPQDENKLPSVETDFNLDEFRGTSQVFLKGMDGICLAIGLKLNDKIKGIHLKALASEALEKKGQPVNIERIRLIFAGKEIKDDDQLIQFKLMEDGPIHLVLRKKELEQK